MVGAITPWNFPFVLGMRVIASDPFAGDATHELDDLLAEIDGVAPWRRAELRARIRKPDQSPPGQPLTTADTPSK